MEEHAAIMVNRLVVAQLRASGVSRYPPLPRVAAAAPLRAREEVGGLHTSTPSSTISFTLGLMDTSLLARSARAD